MTEFWQTLIHLKYTEGSTGKIPITVHTMQAEDWQAMTLIIVVGFKQEDYLPVGISQIFMQQCINLRVDQALLLHRFLNYSVAPVEKITHL